MNKNLKKMNIWLSIEKSELDKFKLFHKYWDIAVKPLSSDTPHTYFVMEITKR